MARQYKKRTASTKRKTYVDYILARAELAAKGYQLRKELSPESFKEKYERLAGAKKAGEIKSQPWDVLMRRERLLISNAQAKNVRLAHIEILKASLPADKKSLKYKEIMQEIKDFRRNVGNVYKLSQGDIDAAFDYIEANKEEGLFGGDYE